MTTGNWEDCVAIIGASGRFPGAGTIAEFWANLAAGTESIQLFSDRVLRGRGVPEALLKHPAYVKAGAELDGIDRFDAGFFDMPPMEAAITDPQHRVLLECAYEALENAGYVGERYPGSVGVFAGVGLNTYLLNNLMPNREVLDSMGMHQLLLGNDKCYATSRIAYKLDLTGPCVAVDTACSTSLVAVVLAFKSLLSYDCDLALAGGAKVNAADRGYLYEPGSINSPDGHCRTFDERAGGTVFGSGAGIVVLKRLEDAVSHRDNIQAVIRGGAINNDGANKVGFTAPSVNRQKEVILQALSFAEVQAGDIDYVEAHGTGTRLGDAVEIQALTEAFGGETSRKCRIGSVKPNVGHLETAAGVTGLIKVLQAFKHGALPASLNLERPNPAIGFENTPFEVVTELTPWPRSETPRRACVSSFGLGGTNAHLVLEEAPERPLEEHKQSELLLLSAKCPAALEQLQRQLGEALSQPQAPLLQDAAFTLAVGRKAFSRRSFAIAGPGERLTFSACADAGHPLRRTAWVIAGQGSQHPGMCRALYERFDVFREAVDECCRVLCRQGGRDVKALLLAAQPDAQLAQQLDNTEYAQPAVFIHAYAMAKQLQVYGMRPDLLLGHSLGEYVAACLAGAIGLDNALRLVAARARLMSSTAPGSMLAVAAERARVEEIVNGSPLLALEIAAVNGPRSIVLSGPDADIERAISRFEKAAIEVKKLSTSHAFHSRLMDPILNDFKQQLSLQDFSAPHTPYVSSLTGQLISAQQAGDPEYWARHLREPVQFGSAVRTLLAAGVDCVVDLGPAAGASALARENFGAQPAPVIINCSAHARQNTPADQVLLGALGAFWSRGGEVDWQAFYRSRGCYRVELPTYPFQRRKCWIEPPAAADYPRAQPQSARVEDAALGDSDISETGVEAADRDAPRNDIERRIAAIWQELLGVAQVKLSDNFFALGGQSLLATRVISRIAEQTGIELDVSVIFDAPTVEGLSLALLEQGISDTDSEELLELLGEMEESL